MKKVAIMALILVGSATAAFSQENKTQKPRMKLYPSSHPSTVETPQQEIARLENQLTALDEKEAWIRSNPEELNKATANGWFANADKQRQEINARLSELKSKK